MVDGLTAGRAGHAVLTVLALTLLAAAPRLWPWLRPGVVPREPIG